MPIPKEMECKACGKRVQKFMRQTDPENLESDHYCVECTLKKSLYDREKYERADEEMDRINMIDLEESGFGFAHNVRFAYLLKSGIVEIISKCRDCGTFFGSGAQHDDLLNLEFVNAANFCNECCAKGPEMKEGPKGKSIPF